ncbi:MAG: cutinase family protein [Rhodococcus sp.]|nr:cutinase family protein [Rhodococcus sp. (in: high G+C Gram-positive bacteria)]
MLSSITAGTAAAAPVRVDPNNYGSQCPEVFVLATSGGLDSGADRDPFDESYNRLGSNWVSHVTVPLGERFASNPGEIGWAYLPYPSTFGLGISPVPTYQESIEMGVARAHTLLDDKKAQCGAQTKFVLLGYSMGSEVTHRVVTEIGARPSDSSSTALTPDDVAGVVFVASPYRPKGAPNLDGPGPRGGGFMSSAPAEHGALTDKTVYVCRRYDIACDGPPRNAAVVLLLQVMGQVPFNLADLRSTVTGFDDALTELAARTAADTVYTPGWYDTQESYLDVLLRAADRTGVHDHTELAPEEFASALKWVTDGGDTTAQQKLELEGARFLEANADFFDLILEPYIFVSFAQHMLYWNNNPNDPWYWESEQIIDWIADLVEDEHATR